MYKAEIAQDSLEQAAIRRRQKLDEERKKRIFDPKTRVLGIDVRALEEQIKIKNEIKSIEKERDASYDQYAKYTNEILSLMDDKVEAARRAHLADMNDFRQSSQRPEQRRDFDLYDPAALKKDRPAREGDEDDRCGVSGLQKFEGEDLEEKERLRLQKLQMKTWVQEQMFERNLKKHQELEERRRYEEYQKNTSQKAQAIYNAVESARNEQARMDSAVNQQLAAFKKHREAEDRVRTLQQNAIEIANHLNGEFLTEKPDVFNIAGGHKVRVDLFKGITPEQKEEILRMQAYQRMEAEQKRLQAREEERRWAQQQLMNHRASLLLEREKARQARALATNIRQENESKAVEDKNKWQYINKVLYTNPPTEDYFAQFNTTSR
ncbi:Protein Tax-1 [Blyttiomyces sp. JEL0837]|nr:Protein Tax-1 [Blyttiomyces sp. JEL0837]